jgi:uncharacterized protein YdhG (YjbR/CyaY superfamily)
MTSKTRKPGVTVVRKVRGSSTTKTTEKKRGARTKTVAPRSVDDYIAGIPEASRTTFDALRAAVRSAAPPDAEEVVSYGILDLRTDRVLVWYAAFRKHCSLFPTASALNAFQQNLAGYTVSKGTVQFPLDAPLPAALVKKLVRARVADVRSGKR